MEITKNFSNFILYSYWRSSCSWRVRIVLNLKNIKYEIKSINLLKGVQRSDDYGDINSFKKVPALEFDKNENGSISKVVLQESSAICEFLEENYPENNLLPKDSIDKAHVRALYSHIACNIQPLQNLPVLNKIEELGYNKIEWAKEWITSGLRNLEKFVKCFRGKYCYGDEITLADAFLVPQLYNARRFNINMDEFPNLVEIEANLKEVEAFRMAAPENQPDALNNL
jgi:maleylacetoacetate isomerase